MKRCDGCGNTDPAAFQPFNVRVSPKLVQSGYRCTKCSRVMLG